jgi:hypothetical protein
MTSRVGKTVPFAIFIRRQKVLTLYRLLFRAARKIDNIELRKSVSIQISSGFRSNANLADSMAIKSSILEGHRYLDQIRSMSSHDSLSSSKENVDTFVVGTDWPWSRK